MTLYSQDAWTLAEFEAEKPVFNFFSKCIKLALSSSKKKKNKPQTSLSKNVRNSPATRKMPRKYVAVENRTDSCFPLAFRRVLLPQCWHCKTPPAVNPTVPKRCPGEPRMAQPRPRHSWPPACPRLPSSDDFAKGNLADEQVKGRPVHLSGCTLSGVCSARGVQHTGLCSPSQLRARCLPNEPQNSLGSRRCSLP